MTKVLHYLLLLSSFGGGGNKKQEKRNRFSDNGEENFFPPKATKKERPTIPALQTKNFLLINEGIGSYILLPADKRSTDLLIEFSNKKLR